MNDNELGILELIHLFVEVLDGYFGNVCELDLVFHFDKVPLQNESLGNSPVTWRERERERYLTKQDGKRGLGAGAHWNNPLKVHWVNFQSPAFPVPGGLPDIGRAPSCWRGLRNLNEQNHSHHEKRGQNGLSVAAEPHMSWRDDEVLPQKYSEKQ